LYARAGFFKMVRKTQSAEKQPVEKKEQGVSPALKIVSTLLPANWI
jgi:hypothetical protein